MDVGLRLNSSDLEYAFWWLLDAPQSGVYLETIYTFSYLERYRDLTFKPCSIICTICGDRVRLNGLHLTANYGKVSVFVGPTFRAKEGLSLIRGITIPGLAIVWILPILAAGIWGVRRRLRGTPVRVAAWGTDLT